MIFVDLVTLYPLWYEVTVLTIPCLMNILQWYP